MKNYVYVVKIYCDYPIIGGIWEIDSIFDTYEKAEQKAKNIIANECERTGYLNFEECLNFLREEGYIEDLVSIDEYKVK